MAAIMKDALGKLIEVGDIVVHASSSTHRVGCRVGIVTKLNEDTVCYTRTRGPGTHKVWKNGRYEVTNGPIKTHIKAYWNCVVIGNIHGQQPALPEDLIDTLNDLKRVPIKIKREMRL